MRRDGLLMGVTISTISTASVRGHRIDRDAAVFRGGRTKSISSDVLKIQCGVRFRVQVNGTCRFMLHFIGDTILQYCQER